MRIWDKKDKLQRMWMAHVLISEYETFNYGCGGNLHIILDDGNYMQADITFCHLEALKYKDVFAINICQILGEMSSKEIKFIVERSHVVEWTIRRED